MDYGLSSIKFLRGARKARYNIRLEFALESSSSTDIKSCWNLWWGNSCEQGFKLAVKDIESRREIRVLLPKSHICETKFN